MSESGVKETSVDDVALGFRDLTVATHGSKRALLHKVTGYVARGCITAGKLSGSARRGVRNPEMSLRLVVLLFLSLCFVFCFIFSGLRSDGPFRFGQVRAAADPGRPPARPAHKWRSVHENEEG